MVSLAKFDTEDAKALACVLETEQKPSKFHAELGLPQNGTNEVELIEKKGACPVHRCKLLNSCRPVAHSSPVSA